MPEARNPEPSPAPARLAAGDLRPNLARLRAWLGVFPEFPVFVPLVREREPVILSTHPARARH